MSRLRALARDTLVMGLFAIAVTGVAVAISYRAQNGLPWLSTYDISVDVPDAGKLLKNADVRIGGARVGQVLAIEAQPPGEDHPPFTRLRVALNPDVGPLPVDTSAEVRLASVLGGKFLDLVPGASERTVAEGGTLALEHASPGIDIDDALGVFDPPTRAALRGLLAEMAGGLAGRGTALNGFLGTLADGLPRARRVLDLLAAPGTDLDGFVRGVADAAQAIEPLAGDLGPLFADGATTLEAVGAADLDRVLAASPGAVGATADALRAVRPVLDDAEAIVAGLEPATPLLEDGLAQVVATMRAATPVARATGALAPAMDEALRALDRFAREPAALGAIRALRGEDLATFGGSAFIGLGAILRTASEAQFNCNTIALWARNMASIASEGDSGGNWLRMTAVFRSDETSHAAAPSPNLHVNPYPNQNARECEAGNEPYVDGEQAIGNPPGDQPKDVEITTRELHP